MQHMEVTRGASRAARGSKGTLAARATGEERRDMTMPESQGRSGFHTVRGGGQPEQDRRCPHKRHGWPEKTFGAKRPINCPHASL
jgi:hypothetical protein